MRWVRVHCDPNKDVGCWKVYLKGVVDGSKNGDGQQCVSSEEMTRFGSI